MDIKSILKTSLGQTHSVADNNKRESQSRDSRKKEKKDSGKKPVENPEVNNDPISAGTTELSNEILASEKIVEMLERKSNAHRSPYRTVTQRALPETPKGLKKVS